MTSNTDRLLPPLQNFHPGNATGLGGWEPGTVAFPDLDDFLSLLNTATGPPQPQHPTLNAPNLNFDFDSLEDLLLAPEQPIYGQGPPPPVDLDFVFGDNDPSFGSSPTLFSSSSPESESMKKSPSVSPAPHSNPLPQSPHSPASTASQPDDNRSVEKSAANPRKRKLLSPEEKEEKAKERAIRNRAAAQESRDKKRKYMDDLEATNATLQKQNEQLSGRLENVEATNRTLIQRLEDLASQLTSLRSQFQTATTSTPLQSTTPSITIPHNPTSVSDALGTLSDPAVVASQQRILSSSRNRMSLTTPYSRPHRSISTPSLTSDQNTASEDPSATTASQISTQAHPLAFIVATAILHSMVSMISRAKPSAVHGRLGTLGSDLWTPAEGGIASSSLKRKGPRLLPDLNGYVACSAPVRIGNFPILRNILDNKMRRASAAA